MSWQDQGRQEHGWFGNGTSAGGGAPDDLVERVGVIAHSVIEHLPRAGRGRAAAAFDDRALSRLRPLIEAWGRAESMSRDAFRQSFLDPGTSDMTVDALRDAARLTTLAKTDDERLAAGAALADAMQRVGLHRWARFLADAAARAHAAAIGDSPSHHQLAQLIEPGIEPEVGGGTDAGAQAAGYVGDNPRQWIGQRQVGNGECVALVQRATGAPRTSEWRQGPLVQGDMNIAPGTAIATFDSNGRYVNDSGGTSHAAIYLGQDEHGIHVVDQWNIRSHGLIVDRHLPHERIIRFSNPRAQTIDQGGSYYVVR